MHSSLSPTALRKLRKPEPRRSFSQEVRCATRKSSRPLTGLVSRWCLPGFGTFGTDVYSSFVSHPPSAVSAIHHPAVPVLPTCNGLIPSLSLCFLSRWVKVTMEAPARRGSASNRYGPGRTKVFHEQNCRICFCAVDQHRHLRASPREFDRNQAFPVPRRSSCSP